MNRRYSVEFVMQVLVGGIVAVLLTTAAASANAKYAAMVIDGHSGKMLYGENIDSPRYPASITKVMTLYLVFEELQAGRLKKSTKMKVSKNASGQAPSKLGLKPGQKISVDHAIRALVTKSANDVAVVIAEHIGGSVPKFAKRMTATARRLGMARTTFVNPHGLPDRRQKTTARDLIKLSQRVQGDFPKYYSYFSTRSFKFRGRTYRNHNKLLGRFKGTTGIKTGYIRASGYNLTASVDRGNKRIVAVVLGGKTGRSRDAHMRKIIERAMPKAIAFSGVGAIRNAPSPAPKPSLIAGTESPANNVPAAGAPAVLAQLSAREPASATLARPGRVSVQARRLAPRNRELPLADTVSRPAWGRVAVASTVVQPRRVLVAPNRRAPAGVPASAAGYAPTEASIGLSSISDLIRSSEAVTPPKSPATQSRRPARLILPASSTIGAAAPAKPRKPTVIKPSTAKPAAVASAPIPDGYQIQVGAYARKGDAEERIEDARKAAARHLSEAMGIAVQAENDKGRFYRARFAGLHRNDATRACKALKRRRIACIVVAQ